ncbi:unnamed protein product [Ostreobium quekettii]|uniref:RNA-binding S4 domain-containing protein n=1 Tax=Ostreobium quekettii TaxID=121088 RepID=A0A8S1ISJ6_9CHLO|nr:unnamed protein product [Ostreobium quekettii]|eukprot:evm.model.scf_174.6 EVM.evm.TU.scf_174.6   scf_174:78330-84728(-)
MRPAGWKAVRETTAVAWPGWRGRGAEGWRHVERGRAGSCIPAQHTDGVHSVDPKAGRRRVRLDELCFAKFPEHSERAVRSWIAQGKVVVDGTPVDKAGQQVLRSSKVELKAIEKKYVSRGGLKLEAALQRFNIKVAGQVAMDAGISTGGFTDCLLQQGASKVYGIDVGYGDVAYKLRQDPRVVLLERTNLLHLDTDLIDPPASLVTLDLSFISVLKVIPVVQECMEVNGDLVVLIKPQFEAGREHVGKGGLVQDQRVHEEVVEKIASGIASMGFDCCGSMDSPILGAGSKNKEFLAHFRLVRPPPSS